MLRYTLRQIDYALHIADTGSVAAAAASLGVAQPSLSAALKKLEEQVGLQLFIRQPSHGLVPSPQGTRFLAEARSLLAHAGDLQRLAEDTGASLSGVLSIGSFTTLAPAFMPRLIAGFGAAHPLASLRLQEGTQTALIEGLRNGSFDAALLYVLDMPSDLALRPLASIEPYALLPARHPLARQEAVSLKDLAEEPMVLLDIPPSNRYFTGLMERAGYVPRVVFSSPSIELVRGLVGQGLGFSLLVTRPHGDRSYDGEPLAVRPILEETEKGEIALATLKGVRPTRLVKAFTDFAAGALARP